MPRPSELPGLAAERTRILSAFGALCLFFSAVEYLFPRPLPFFRIGLSNIPLVLALDFMDLPSLALLAAVKALGQALLNGTLSSYVFLFSAAGTAASLLCMWSLGRLLGRRVGPVGLASAGALASNAVQVILSIAFIFGPSSQVIAPILLGIGSASGFLMGLFAAAFRERSAWLARTAERWKGEAG